MISKLTLEQIKLDLIKSLDRYGIRIFFKAKYLTDTSMNTCITNYNEQKIFGKKLNENELLVLNDINFHKRTSVSFLQKHERFSHVKKIFNKNESNYIDSPRGYLDFRFNDLRILKPLVIQDNDKGEIGESLEYFMTNGQNYLIDNLFYCSDDSFNFENIFKINLMLENTNCNLINALKTIPGKKEEDYDVNNIVEDDKNDENNIIINNNIKFRLNSEIKKIEKDNNKENNQIKEYIREKNKLISESFYRKYTFERSTICNYKFDNIKNKFVPDKKFP